MRHSHLFQLEDLDVSLLKGLPKKYQNQYLHALNSSSFFFELNYSQWLTNNGIISNVFINKFSTEPVVNWYSIGHSAFPALWSSSIVIEPVKLGTGSYAECYKVATIRGAFFSFSKHQMDKLVMKKLKYGPDCLKQPRLKGTNELENLVEIKLGSILAGFEEYFLTLHTVVIRDFFLKYRRVCGFLMNQAEFGTLQQWLRSNACSRDLNIGLIQNLHHLLQAIHKLHQHRYLHCDIKGDNVFVVQNSNPKINSHVSFRLGDFGTACKFGQGVVYAKRSNYEKGEIFPIELFSRKYRKKIGTQTDWYEFGYLLKWVGCQLFPSDSSDFMQLFGNLIQGLTKYSPIHGRFGHQIAGRYFSLFSKLNFIPPFTIVKTLHVLTNEKKKYYALVSEGAVKKKNKVNFFLLGALNGLYLYGAFILAKQLQYLHYDYYACTEHGDDWLAANEYLATKSYIFKFTQDFPLPVTASFNFLSMQPYFKDNIVVIESNTPHWVCFCQQFCFQKHQLGPYCSKSFFAHQFESVMNACWTSPCVVLQNEHEIMLQ